MQVNRIQTNAYHRLSMEENQKKASQIAIIQQQKARSQDMEQVQEMHRNGNLY